jgi:hypothetical protein
MDKEKVQNQDNTPNDKIDEQAGFYLQSHLKITDPDTKEVLVNTRA